MTDKRTLKLNFVVASLLLGTAAGLLMVFGASALAVYTVAGSPALAFVFFVGCLTLAVGCMLALLRITRKLKAKLDAIQ